MKNKILHMIQAFKEMMQSEDQEYMANVYSLRCFLFCLLADTFCLILNITGIFIIDAKLFMSSYIALLVLAAIYFALIWTLGLQHKSMKYISICIFNVLTIISGIILTYHILILVTIPIVLSGMYSDKKLSRLAYILALLSIVLTVYFGYANGICDANMALLTTTTLSHYTKDGMFLARRVNPNPALYLGLYYVIPRSLLLTAFYVVNRNVLSIFEKSAKKAASMEKLAITDKMTGVYNKSKLIDDLQNKVYHKYHIAVIYWDVNHLKKVNDSFGHFIGDALITKVAETIRQVKNEDGYIYRYGGDEFIMIIKHGTLDVAKERVLAWKKQIQELKISDTIPVTAAVGYAAGTGSEIEAVIGLADQEMYQDKIKNHQER